MSGFVVINSIATYNPPHVSIQQIKQSKQAIIRRHVRADNVQGFIQVLITLAPLALIWWLAVWSVDVSYWLTAAAIVLLTLFTVRVLVLMHECGHNSLFHTPRLNRALGFVFGVLAGMPQQVWSQHHDFHHANNGNWEKYRGPLTTSSVDEFAAMSKAQQRWYCGARSVFLAPLGGFVYLLFNPRYTWLKGSLQLLLHLLRGKIAQPEPSLRAHAATFTTRYWTSPRQYWHMFWNNVVLFTVCALMSWAIGPGLFSLMFLISVSVAGGIAIAIFTVQHNFEHAYATDSGQWDFDAGAIHGSSFLVLPHWLNWFTVNIGYHHVHHLSARIPCYHLVACHNENEQLFADVTRLKLSEIPHALTCLLWDASAERIITVAEYRARA